MNLFDEIKSLRTGELATLNLRTLYEAYGYKKFSMMKFEEYDFYSQNMDFLQNNRLLTFTGASGKLMALRPDVTMSIVKKTRASAKNCEKLYYIENVYRADSGAAEFRESSQIGIEHIGQVTPYTTLELTALAIKSLDIIQDENILDISHMGYLNGLLNEYGLSGDEKKRLRRCIESKNAHELRSIAGDGLPDELTGRLIQLMRLPEAFGEALEIADSICINDQMRNAISELAA